MSHGTAGIATGGGVGWMGTQLYACDDRAPSSSTSSRTPARRAAFRAPGQPQGAFALEQLIDELAEKLAHRSARAARQARRGTGGTGTGRQRRGDARGAQGRAQIGAERFGWHKRRPPGSDKGAVKRGIGMAQSMWGRFVDLDSACEVRLHKDGSVELLSSVQDIGTGTRTALARSSPKSWASGPRTSP